MTNEDKEKSSRLKQYVEKHARDSLAANHAVAHLFPKFARDLGAYMFDDGFHKQRAEFRIANKDFSQAYFSLTPMRAHWSKEELEAIFKADVPLDALTKVEERIASAPDNDRFRLRRMFLEQLQSAFETGRATLTQEWLDALIELSPIYIKAPDELAAQLFSIDFITRLEFAIIQGLEKLALSVRAQLFGNAIKVANDISLLCVVFRAVAGDVNLKGDTRQLSKAEFGEANVALRLALLEKIYLYVSDGRIWRQADPRRVLWFWWGADQRERVFEFTRREMDRPEGLRALLKITIQPVRSTDGNYEIIPLQADEIVDIQMLADRAKSLLGQSESQEDRDTARKFLGALDNRNRD